MKILIYDGSHAADPMAAQVHSALLSGLQARGWEAETIVLRQQRLGNCAGDFFCWVRSPGLCNTDDDNRVIAAKMMQADLLIYLTPVTFGGYSSVLKRMVDHQIQNLTPFFALSGGETHHQRRYARYPNLLAIGWTAAPEAQASAVFGNLVQRNGLNLFARTVVSGVVPAGQPAAALAAQIEAWLDASANGISSRPATLAAAPAAAAPAAAVQRAVLLVGSPRLKKSTSASLGGHLFAELAARGVATETIPIYTAFSSAARAQRALAAVAAADLVVVAFPLYVDSLPAPVIAALEKIAAQGQAGRPSRARFAAIANCGFPEAAHNATALAICAEFAQQCGFGWAGGLALGGGEGLVHGVPLGQLDGRATRIKQALASAAASLAAGQSIPLAAARLMARPIIPNWLYRLLGSLGWWQQAWHFGAQNVLGRRPYVATEGPVR